jgi:flagellar motor switch protein FliN/FliY
MTDTELRFETSTSDTAAGWNRDAIMRIPVKLQVVFGSASMPVSQLMKLGRGGVVALDRRVGDPVEIVVNGRVVARGDIVVVDEATSRLGVSLTEIVGANGRADSSTGDA